MGLGWRRGVIVKVFFILSYMYDLCIYIHHEIMKYTVMKILCFV